MSAISSGMPSTAPPASSDAAAAPQTTVAAAAPAQPPLRYEIEPPVVLQSTPVYAPVTTVQPTPHVLPRQDVQPEPFVEKGITVHPPPRYAQRQVIHPQPQLLPGKEYHQDAGDQPAEQEQAPPRVQVQVEYRWEPLEQPAHITPSDIDAVWKHLPPVQHDTTRPEVKIRPQCTDVTQWGKMLDVFL